MEPALNIIIFVSMIALKSVLFIDRLSKKKKVGKMARKKNSAWKDGKQKFSKYVSPSPFYITAGDSHNFCVVCLGSMHSQHPSGLATCIVSVCL